MRPSDNLLKFEHHAVLKKCADELRKLATENIALHLVLTNKLELSLNDKDVFLPVCINIF